METKQPKWKQVGTIGDVNFVDYDGGPVFVDESGVYPAELEYVQNMPVENENHNAYVYRIMLDRLKLSSTDHLIPFRYDASWPYPEASYTEWFDEDLYKVCASEGISLEDFYTAITSDNPMALASAYEALARYHGWENFDSYPLHFLNREELEERYENHPRLRKEEN